MALTLTKYVVPSLSPLNSALTWQALLLTMLSDACTV